MDCPECGQENYGSEEGPLSKKVRELEAEVDCGGRDYCRHPMGCRKHAKENFEAAKSRELEEKARAEKAEEQIAKSEWHRRCPNCELILVTNEPFVPNHLVVELARLEARRVAELEALFLPHPWRGPLSKTIRELERRLIIEQVWNDTVCSGLGYPAHDLPSANELVRRFRKAETRVRELEEQNKVLRENP